MGNKRILEVRMRDIKDVLRAWANVRVSKRIGIEYPYKSAAFHGAKRENDYRTTLNEDEAKQVDDAMCLLAKANKFWYELIKNYYIENKSYERLSIISCMSYKHTRLEIEKAETYIFAKLDDKIHDIAA